MAKQTETSAVEAQQEVAATTDTNGNATEASSQPGNNSSSEAVPKRNYRAIARVQGALVVDDDKLFIVTDGDGTWFPVLGVRPHRLPLKLIALLPDERKGLFGFWPQEEEGVIIASFSHPETYTQHENGPLPDEMLLSGKVQSCRADSFVVRIKRNKDSWRGNRWFKSSSVTVSSTPPPAIQTGQWAELKLQRSGSEWILPDT